MLHFALMLRFASIVTFCGVTSFHISCLNYLKMIKTKVMLHQHLLFLCQLETTVKQTWLLMLKTNFSLILFKPLETLPVHRRCFIFLFVLLENIGVRKSEASTRVQTARKKHKNVYFLLPPPLPLCGGG